LEKIRKYFYKIFLFALVRVSTNHSLWSISITIKIWRLVRGDTKMIRMDSISYIFVLCVTRWWLCVHKGDFLVREGQLCQYVFFIKQGMVKICSFIEDREFIMRFFTENTFVTVVNSFTEQTPSHFQIKALEDFSQQRLSKRTLLGKKWCTK